LIQDLLIRVKAASVNPLDVLMSQGYGFSLFELMKSRSVENFSTFNPFPITLGRDFSGVVVDKGMDVGDLQVGDQVRN
jgi:NADPH:quinone reductase-like Zn-dependent oxidoreductase